MSLSHFEVPHFPRGFLLSARDAQVPPTYVEGPLLPNFYVHPWTNVHVAGDHRLFVISIGHIVPISAEQTERPTDFLLAALHDGEAAFFEALSRYSGRHVVIFGSEGNLSVVNDATAMRSVFYAAEGGVIASHPLLVEQALGGTISKNDLPFRYGYPGNRTPYNRTRILTPNTYYWVTANVIRRFWPVVSPAPKTVNQAAETLLESSAFALSHMAKERQVNLTLTAGLDSRAILAIALYAGIDFKTYTYGDRKDTEIDRKIAARLADIYDLSHTEVSQKLDFEGLQERLSEGHYSMHHSGWVGSLIDHYRDPETLALLGNLLEIGRMNHGPSRQRGESPPSTASGMRHNHYILMGKAVKDKIDRFGFDEFWRISIRSFQAFIDETGFDISAGLLDPFDHFYWEHRMAAWQGYAMGERDFYSIPFIPFNSRYVFETMLGVSDELRHDDQIVYKMIRMVDPALLDIPINPKKWSGGTGS